MRHAESAECSEGVGGAPGARVILIQLMQGPTIANCWLSVV